MPLSLNISKLLFIQYLNPFISDKKSYLMTFLTYFDVFMALWSYFQTMRISSQVSKLQ